MNWDRVEGQWKQRRGKATSHWGKMMNDELAAIAGKHEQLVGILQEKYGIAKEEAKRQVVEFKKNIDHLKKSNASLLKSQNWRLLFGSLISSTVTEAKWMIYKRDSFHRFSSWDCCALLFSRSLI